jgi:dTDP-4-amino-4,6-dideoxygalactose transaminase
MGRERQPRLAGLARFELKARAESLPVELRRRERMRQRMSMPPDELVRKLRFDAPVHVTRPAMPPLPDYVRQLERIWETAWLTNAGALHEEFEQNLARRLGVEHLSLCCNGTVALLLALQACGIEDGDVITTPFTFPATPHAIHWNRLRPVFSDIEENTFNLDPEQIEGHIGKETRAILPVHVFGNPCDVDAIQGIADRHGLPVIYDAAHALGVKRDGRPIVESGDLSVLSFHATKHFTTAEGGAIVSSSASLRARVESLRDFGIADEETVIGYGINGKMSELHAGLGLCQLDALDSETAARRELTACYRERLASVPGIRFPDDDERVQHNYTYLPVLVDAREYGLHRDRLLARLRDFNVYCRKYFHPLCNRIPPYASLPSADPEKLPVSERVADRVLCLPLYGSLEKSGRSAPDHAFAELELAVRDASIRGVDSNLHDEAEGLLEPVDGARLVVVGQAGGDLR